MAEPLTDEMLAMIRRTWDGVDSAASKLTVTNTKTPGQLLHALSCAPRDVPRLLAEVERLRAHMAAVEKFVAARAEYITAINNCHPDNYADYHRWQGHAEGRRQLAQNLGLPVAWPPEYERDATEPGA